MRILLSIFIVFYACTLLAQAPQAKLYFQKDTLANAQTAILFLEGKDIKDAKLTFENLSIDFLKHSKKENTHFALIPISYHTKPNKYKIAVSYTSGEKQHSAETHLNVIDGKYKSETLSVQPSKVKPNEEDSKRAKKEYTQAIKIYKQVSNGLITDFKHPINSKITSAFGNKRVYNGTLQSFHSGTDYRAAIGTPIYASASGIVKIASNRFYAGNSVVIDHGYGLFSCYFHLDKISVKEGQEVAQGELLGYSGDTGRVSGPHLHFGIRLKNIIVDPVQFIEAVKELN